MEKIEIKCSGSAFLNLHEITPLQGDLKDLSKENYNKLKNQILKNGFISPFHIWKGGCLDGHQRLRVLKKMESEGYIIPERFPIVEVEAKDLKQAKKILLSLTSQYGTMTNDGLYTFMNEAEIDFPELDQDFQFDKIDFKDFEKEYFADEIGSIPGEDNVPEDAPTISKLGDIWHLGNHKIMNADCTVEENVKRLMGDEKADMVFTDPPYGVDYDVDNRPKPRKESLGKIANDNLLDNFLPFLIKTFINLDTATSENCSAYIWFADKKTFDFYSAIESSDWSANQTIIWKKPMLLGRGKYQWAHEPCLFAIKGSPFFTPDRTKTTVWDFGGYDKSKNLHPSQKPVFLAEEAISNSSKEGQKIIDFFLGSGSTLIACEKTNRRCLGLEIDPHYIDVIVKRYSDFTHQSDNIYLERNGEKIPYASLIDLNPIP